MSDVIEAAEAHVENMKKTFSLEAVLADKVTYPTDTVDIFLDGASAYEVLTLTDEVTTKKQIAELSRAEDGTIAGSPEAEALDAEVAKLEKELQAVLDKASKSMLTLTLRGVPAKVWRVIDEKARREYPPNKHDGQEEAYEKNIRRNEWQTIELVKYATVGIKDAEGNEVDTLTITRESVEGLYDALYETEWRKVVEMANQLTFANALFDDLAENDADFTLPSSPDEETQDTQN